MSLVIAGLLARIAHGGGSDDYLLGTDVLGADLTVTSTKGESWSIEVSPFWKQVAAGLTAAAIVVAVTKVREAVR